MSEPGPPPSGSPPSSPRPQGGPYPGGARFAFTILDDTDVATRQNVEPVYRLLHQLGLGATKTVWPLGCPEGSRNFWLSETLEDDDYLAFVRDLVDWGFEVTWHGATMESSRRERTLAGFQRFQELLDLTPRVHVNHSYNRENIYWGPARIDSRVLGWLYRKASGTPPDHFLGHVLGSDYWWGDLARTHIEYARNLSFNDINTLRWNPSMPYRDPKRPLIRRWFSGSDAEGVDEFNKMLSSENQDRLEREEGVCIMSTHLGKGFAPNGQLNDETRARLEELAGRAGWFPNVGDLLRWLETRRDDDELPATEWLTMQWRWGWDLAMRKWRARNA